LIRGLNRLRSLTITTASVKRNLHEFSVDVLSFREVCEYILIDKIGKELQVDL